MSVDKRTQRVRYKLRNVEGRLRLSVFRSLKHVAAQIIDDSKEITIVSVSSNAKEFSKKSTKMEKAALIGKAIAEKMKEQKLSKVVFDRGPYAYHGVVKALAEAARANGLEF